MKTLTKKERKIRIVATDQIAYLTTRKKIHAGRVRYQIFIPWTPEEKKRYKPTTPGLHSWYLKSQFKED